MAAVLRVCVLYPEEMSAYSDRGDLIVLERRCATRGIEFQLTAAGIGDGVASSHDLYYLGGGQDAEQRQCGIDLVERKADFLHAAVRRGAVILGIGGGFQLLGRSCELAGGSIAGLGLIDMTTDRPPAERIVGFAVVRTDIDGRVSRLAGFENHAGHTFLGPGVSSLGTVLVGGGNNGSDTTEGARVDKVIGTHLHGPLLAVNAWFADWLIKEALGLPALEPLDDDLELSVHEAWCDRGFARGRVD